jgi:hypothetical protein
MPPEEHDQAKRHSGVRMRRNDLRAARIIASTVSYNN